MTGVEASPLDHRVILIGGPRAGDTVTALQPWPRVQTVHAGGQTRTVGMYIRDPGDPRFAWWEARV